MLDLFLFAAVFAGGYIVSIYSWPWIRLQANGLSAEAISLRVKAQQIENKIKGAL